MKTLNCHTVFSAACIHFVVFSGIAIGQDKTGEQPAELVKVFSLSQANALELTRVLHTVLDPIKHIVADERTNTLIVKAAPDAIEVVAALIDRLDEPYGKLRMFALSHASAAELQNTLKLVFRDSVVSMAADKRTNILVVKASDRELQAIAEVVQALDVERKPATAAGAPVRPKATRPSANQVAIHSDAPGTTKIKSLVANGTKVNQGDLLVELDDSELKAQVMEMHMEISSLQQAVASAEREIAASQSKSAAAAESEVMLAELRSKQSQALRELEQAEADAEVTVADKVLEFAQLRLDRLRELVKAGQVGPEEAMEAELERTKARAQVEVAQARRKLLATVTLPLKNAEVQVEMERAKARLHDQQQEAQRNREQAAAELEAARVQLRYSLDRVSRLEQQLDKFKIYAPAGGVVQIGAEIKKGAIVRRGQPIVLLSM